VVGEIAILALKGDQLGGTSQRLPVTKDEFGLVVERIDVAEGAGTEDDEDVLAAGNECGLRGASGLSD
jgi:hypothetical protein